jgi:hypothetical protein
MRLFDAVPALLVVPSPRLLGKSSQGSARTTHHLRLVPFWNRRPRCGADHGGNDVPRTSPPLGLRCAEPSHFILSAGDGPYFRGAAGPYAPWPGSVAAEAGERLDRPAGRGAIRLPDQRPARGGQVSPSSQPPRDDDMLRLRPFDILKRTIGGSVVTAASAALARPKRFERVTLAFGGQDSTKK